MQLSCNPIKRRLHSTLLPLPLLLLLPRLKSHLVVVLVIATCLLFVVHSPSCCCCYCCCCYLPRMLIIRLVVQGMANYSSKAEESRLSSLSYRARHGLIARTHGTKRRQTVDNSVEFDLAGWSGTLTHNHTHTHTEQLQPAASHRYS